MIQARTLERKMVTISEAERIIKESKTPGEAVERLRSLPKRQPKPPAPEGGIGIREAARKYGISRMTVSRWANKGKIRILQRRKNWLYVDEGDLKLQLENINN